MFFQNEYQSKRSEVKMRDTLDFDNESIANEKSLMKSYESELTKILKIQKKYEDKKVEFKRYYDESKDEFADSNTTLTNLKNSMSAEVSHYVSSFDEKIEEIIDKYNEYAESMDKDYEMIKSGMDLLDQKKDELHNKFYEQYYRAMEKLNT